MQEIDLAQRQGGLVVGQAIGRNARHQVDRKIKMRAVPRRLVSQKCFTNKKTA
jgi:hypothetical protein